MVPHSILLLLFFLSGINAQIALPPFQGVHKPHTAEDSCDQSVTITTSDEGWYNPSGTHNSNNSNTATCQPYYNSWFTFDLSSFSGTACSITLRLGLEYFSGSTKTHTIYNVSTDHDDLVASSSGSSGITIYNDLGGGNSYSSKTVSSSDRNTVLEYTINSQGITDFNSAAGGWFSIGTAVSEGCLRFGTRMDNEISTLVITYSN